MTVIVRKRSEAGRNSSAGEFSEGRLSGQLEFDEEDEGVTLRRTWEQCLHLLASKVPVVTFETYIRPLQPVSYQGNTITLGVASPYAKDWLEKKSTNAIRSALEFHLDVTGLQIVFVVLSRDQRSPAPLSRKTDAAQTTLPLDADPEETVPNPAQNQASVPPPTRNPRSPAGRKAEPKQEEIVIPSLPLNERYYFNTFLVGRSNRLAHAGAVQVAEKPGEIYNPLFLYGGPGLGKTHLMHAIAHQMRIQRPEARIAYVSGEYFAQHYITALKEHATETFRRQYRMVDVWLVDDIQFIAGKEHTKEEFFHTFNTLYGSGKQIVLASDRSPRELNTMDERLRSRFQSGLIADISPPELETRLAILQNGCVREKVKISDDVLLYIASAIQSNIRALEGAFTKLLAYSSIMKLPINEELAQGVLGEYFIEKPIRVRKVTVQEVVEAVGEQFGITASAILGPGRNKDISLARQAAIYLCRELMPESNTSLIGAAFGGRDHATVVYACQKMKLVLDIDPELKGLILKLRKSLQ